MGMPGVGGRFEFSLVTGGNPMGAHQLSYTVLATGMAPGRSGQHARVDSHRFADCGDAPLESLPVSAGSPGVVVSRDDAATYRTRWCLLPGPGTARSRERLLDDFG